MRKVGNLKRLLVAMGATAAVLVVASVSGAASPTDASVTEFDQCANGGPPSTATDCPEKWINGILNQQNSHYAEDEVTPQRVVLDLPKNGPATGRTVEISYLTRKGGVHAYDSLATWNTTQSSADRCGANLSAANCVPGPATTFPIPSDPTVVADNNGPGSATSGHELGGQVFTMYGGTITGVSSYSHDDPSGSSDSYAHITLTYSVPSFADDAKVMLLFGGHIASSLGPRGWGVGVGAGSIEGGPYHIRITAADGASVGNRDNQIMSSAILSPANIVIKKVAVGGDATFDYAATGSALPGNFSIATSGGMGQATFTNIIHGAYTVTESAPPAGWDFTSVVCQDEDGGTSVDLGLRRANIDLDPGETVICTYTNTKRGKIIVEKQTNPDGDPQLFSFSPSYGSAFSLSDGQQNDSGFLAAGSYSVSETAPSGWSLTSATCDDGSSPSSIGLSAGETVKCTFVNTKQGQVIVKKVMVGGSDTFNFSGTPSGAISVNNGTISADVAPGQYLSTEGAAPGWDLTSVLCNDGNSSGSVPNRQATFNVEAGETVTCTFTNTKQGQVIVIKHVINDNGGSKSASDFPIQVSGSSPSPANFAGAEAPGTSVSIGPGAYNVTETEDPAYAASYSAGCSGTLPAGGSATCTVTNNDKPATLTVIKHVVNDNGGSATASNFTMTINGVTAQGGNSFPGAESPGVTKTLTTVGAYNVSESSLAGYTQTSASADCAGTIALGESKTCTITNDDLAAKLIVIKHVVNDNGGTASSGDFTMTVDDAGSNPPSFPGAEAPGTEVPVDPGAYSVSESGPAGYQMSQSADCSGTIALGQTKTCTVTNDDAPARLTVIKHVVNDNGGSATASNFTMTINGVTAQGGNSFPGAESPGVTKTLTTVGAYNVSESSLAGYTQTSASADCAGTIALGESKTCTITNDDHAPKLTLVKQVINDNGGSAQPSAWTLTAAGPSGFSGAGPSVSSGPSFDAGSYNLSEAGPAGYDASAWDCTGESQVDGDTVSVALGDDITCTITNNDKPATLIVKKVVVNDNGGTKHAQDFSFSVNGGQAQAFEADGQNDLAVAPGTYNVTEPAVAGYTTTYSNCAHILLRLGETATCTITNNDVPRGQGSIDVQKSADPTSIKEPGGQVAYSVRIVNTSADVDVTIGSVVDDKFGDLDDEGGKGYIDVPHTLPPGGSVSFQFTAQITGVGGTSHVNTVTGSGTDENGNPVSDSDDARVDITPRLIDLVIVKDATSPTPLNGIVHYTLTVTNKGPDTATNVQLADPAPAGITYLTASPSQGSCSVTAALITCSLGTIAPGQTVTINVTGRATVVGTHTNTATVTGSGGRETNPADNVDSAVTVVPAPLKPPTAKPKPKPEPEVCLTLTVSPKMIKADGKPDKVVVKVTAGKKRMKGVKVIVSGAGVRKTAKSNGKGVAVLRINPKKAGLITITALETNQRVCGPKRIGVVGVFLPPVTG